MRVRRRWVPSPAIRASMGLHLAAGAMLIARPGTWPLALGVAAADHGVLAGAGLWPRSRLLGPNWTRLPAAAAALGQVAITIDDGPDPEVTPAMLDALARGGVTATFFCIGERAVRHPQLVRRIVAAGHAVENHSDTHRHAFSLLGPAALGREVARAQAGIAAISGIAPAFFRAPAGLRNPLLEPVLARHGLRLASWSRRGFDTVSRDPDRVLARLTHALRGGEILLLHDGHSARMADGAPIGPALLPRLIDVLRRRALVPITLRAALEQECRRARDDPG